MAARASRGSDGAGGETALQAAGLALFQQLNNDARNLTIIQNTKISFKYFVKLYYKIKEKKSR
jgi:hypothetical protein